MTGYPRAIAAVDQREPVPRRVRAVLGGRTVVDTTRALYVWERPPYPQFYIPIEDVAADVVVDENHEQKLRRGTARRLGLKVDGTERNAAARVYTDGSLKGYARLEWDALDAWFEEDEEIFVHPRIRTPVHFGVVLFVPDCRSGRDRRAGRADLFLIFQLPAPRPRSRNAFRDRHTGWCRSMNCGGPLTVSVGEGGYRWTTPSISGCSIPARGIRRAGSGAG